MDGVDKTFKMDPGTRETGPTICPTEKGSLSKQMEGFTKANLKMI